VSGRLVATAEPLALGSARLMAQLGFDLPAGLGHPGRPGQTTVYLGRSGRVVAAFRLVDGARPSAGEALASLDRLGVHLAVLTGDSPEAASVLASELGLADVRAGLRPADKARLVAAAPRAHGTVAMLGDGLNDGPALAAADVGIAMGNGADLARTSAPVVLAGDDLRQVAWLLGLARRVDRAIRLNLFWATVYNALGIGLAAAGLLQPVLAALAMVVSSLLVLGNSLRLQRQKRG
jgi:P-type E1-E2 ATPase